MIVLVVTAGLFGACAGSEPSPAGDGVASALTAGRERAAAVSLAVQRWADAPTLEGPTSTPSTQSSPTRSSMAGRTDRRDPASKRNGPRPAPGQAATARSIGVVSRDLNQGIDNRT